MTAKLDTLRTTYKSSSDSPKGRGHRVAKKKVMEDFVDVVPKCPAKTATNNAKKASKEQVCVKLLLFPTWFFLSRGSAEE